MKYKTEWLGEIARGWSLEIDEEIPKCHNCNKAIENDFYMCEEKTIFICNTCEELRKHTELCDSNQSEHIHTNIIELSIKDAK